MLKRLFTLFLSFLIITIVACKNDPDKSNTNGKSDGPNKNEVKTVGILVQTTVNPFFLDFAEAAEQELGREYEVVLELTPDDSDAQSQLDALQQ